MERKIGETFEFEGKTLQVKETSRYSCDGCFFEWKCLSFSKKIAGLCESENRTDKKEVIFVEVQEQPQKLNLCEILKDCPQGETFWSPLLGDVKLYCTDQEAEKVVVTAVGNVNWSINADGTIPIESFTSPEIMLYPSREQRDWTKVKYKPQKERFDPKTLKPFDKVLARDNHNEKWCCDIFSNIDDNEYSKYITISYSWKYCIPYNDDTKHLVGTIEEAPEFYRYWKD